MIILTKSKSWGKDSSNVTRFEWGAPNAICNPFWLHMEKKSHLGWQNSTLGLSFLQILPDEQFKGFWGRCEIHLIRNATDRSSTFQHANCLKCFWTITRTFHLNEQLVPAQSFPNTGKCVFKKKIYIYIYICVCVCVCVCAITYQKSPHHKLSLTPQVFGGGYKSNLVHSQPPSGISIPLHQILQNHFVFALSQ